MKQTQLFKDKKKIEKTTGIYYLFENNKIVYVGQSSFCEKRIMNHIDNKNFNEYVIKQVKNEMLNEVEATEIIKYKPKYNKRIPKNKLFVSLVEFLKEKNGKKPSSIKKRLSKIFSIGIKPIIFNELIYFEKKDLKKIDIK